jgi:DNA-binding transcriptional regulator GbsR (MarR family)
MIPDLKKDILEIFVQMGYVIGIPDIIMKIYAIVWMEQKPVSQGDIQDALKALHISLGKTVISVTLKEMVQIGAIDKIKDSSQRTNLYAANSSLIKIYQLSVSKILGPAELRMNRFAEKYNDTELGKKLIKEVNALHTFLKYLLNQNDSKWLI